MSSNGRRNNSFDHFPSTPRAFHPGVATPFRKYRYTIRFREAHGDGREALPLRRVIAQRSGGFPEDVRGNIGHALHEAQCGLEPYSAKALQGFSGRGILEVIEDHDGSTFRAAYTVRFAEAIYVLHCFQKKSKKGIATPQHQIELIRSRLHDAEADHRARIMRGGSKP